MIKGLYTAASSMLANQRELNIISNNLANASTTGYKRDEGIKESFPEMLIYRLQKGKSPKMLGTLGTGVQLQETHTDHSSGKMLQTGNNLDVAIQGKGYFVVMTPQGRRYTRDGNFTLNRQGQIVTKDGYPVLGQRGLLQTINGRAINISEDGQLFLGNLRGDRFQIVEFADENLLEKKGNNYFALGQAEEQAAGDYRLMQGYLENSNVNVVQEMVKMIETTRLYEANQKVIKTADDTLGKAVNEVGRLR